MKLEPPPYIKEEWDWNWRQWLSKVCTSVNYNGAVLSKTSNQAITTATISTVTWDEVVVYGQHEVGDITNNRLIVPNGTRLVRLLAQVTWDNTSVADVSSSIDAFTSAGNGAAASTRIAAMTGLALGEQEDKPSIDSTGLGVPLAQHLHSGPIPVQDGDYFELNVVHNRGSDLNVTSALNSYTRATWFSMELIG
jgi:hypothetical protein